MITRAGPSTKILLSHTHSTKGTTPVLMRQVIIKVAVTNMSTRLFLDKHKHKCVCLTRTDVTRIPVPAQCQSLSPYPTPSVSLALFRSVPSSLRLFFAPFLSYSGLPSC